jgi:hypothetical protein
VGRPNTFRKRKSRKQNKSCLNIKKRLKTSMNKFLISNHSKSTRKKQSNCLLTKQKQIIINMKNEYNKNIKVSFISIHQFYCSQIIEYTIIGILKIKIAKKIYYKFSNIAATFNSLSINIKIYSEQIASISK